MKRARRLRSIDFSLCDLPRRLVRWTSLCVCFALVLTSLAMVPLPLVSSKGSIFSTQGQGNQGSPNGKGQKVKPAPPEKGAPAANLPNLDEVKRRHDPEPEAPAPIPSTMRSKRKPLESRRGKRVGDPGTTGVSIGYGNGSERSTSARPGLQTATRLHHAGARARTLAPPPLGDDQFIQNFFYWAFLRYPNSTELAYWDDVLRTAYTQGQTAMLIAMRELGMTVFESAEYAARNRSNHDYAYDLYKTFLMRDPDSGGWSYWENLAPTIGRENVRHGFEYSTEFANLVATLTPNGSASSNAASLVTARVDPNNQTGNQMLARDCEWSVGLLNLPGRAGLDLGLGLSYSSLVWTRSGSYLYFDEDSASPSPGFRLGFATIQGPHFDAQAARNVYVLITSSGHRVELRQVGNSNVYEAGDSSYLQLIDNGGSLLVRTTDGTQITYGWFENEWRATQIKDRNGNYLTINNDWRGDIQNITDTLGRVIAFNYDGNANLVSITQIWNGVTHTWASFGWGTPLSMSVSGFSGASVVGTFNGELIPVLRQVGLDDGSYYTFDYTPAGQVNLIRRYTSDNVQRSYTAYDYTPATNDCPRISQTRVWVENWTGLNGVPGEVITQYNEPGDGSHQLVAPDGTVYKEFYAGSAGFQPAWGKGLVVQSEIWSGGVRQKWTTTAYTQDNTGVSYQTNPRVTETSVYDANGNRRRTTVAYTSYSLPSDVYEYAADAVTVLRRTHTDYRWDGPFITHYIIGLPDGQFVYEGSGALASITVYGYDWGDSRHFTPVGPSMQHDDANYGANFVYGRGNLTGIGRFNVNAPNDWGQMNWSSLFGYDLAGNVVMTRDGMDRLTTIDYADNYSDNINRNTRAYPTKVTDPDNFFSTAKYDFNSGAVTGMQGPPPVGQSQGATQTMIYDDAGRITRVTTDNNGAYTRYVYGPYWVQSFSTLNTIADEAYSITTFDGAGRAFTTTTNHPGSAGGYKLVNVIFDQMGRPFLQSNPTEVNSSWLPAGDDAYNPSTGEGGVHYSLIDFDWKGRTIQTTHPDGTYATASYAGCGCAGGAVVTLTDEVGRQQKVYSDVLGRQWKTEVLNWNGTVYSATTNSFNARDQVTLVRQWAGAENGGGAYQDTTMTFDGYGRLQSKHVPEQNAGTATVYSYNNDDTINSVTDARGASATYSYNNNRHLVSGITYSAPAGITVTAPVTFGYDAVGNRTSMTDGSGSKSYSYNQLSQMSSETRTFNGVGTFTLSYDYNLGGELKKITDATNMTINYAFDSTGRLAGVTGSDSLYAGVSNYASNFQYRAWGGLKAMIDGANHVSSLLYNSKLQPTHFDISGNVVNQNYDYNNDGRISFVHNTTDPNFDRSYSYDHLGRLTQATTAAGGFWAPYYETFGYDALSNLTSRYTSSWGQDEFWDGASYTNNRRVGWGYDADGRNTTIDTRTYTFDAAGQQTLMTGQRWAINHYIPTSESSDYDGDGVKIKDVAAGVATYYLRSSALGEAIIEELNSTGQKNAGYVYYVGGRQLATQTNNEVIWKHSTPANTSKYEIHSSSGYAGRVEFDPLGADVKLEAPPTPDPGSGQGDVDSRHVGALMDSKYAALNNPAGGCVVDGFETGCANAMMLVNHGTGNSTAFVDNGSVTMHDIAHSVLLSLGPEVFAPAGTSMLRINVSGLEGTPRHGTVEWQWITGIRDANGNILPSVFGPVPTAYSGTAAMPGSVVSLASSVAPQNPVPNVGDLQNRLTKILSNPDCTKFISNLINGTATAKNPAEFTDAMTGFGKIQSQGGFIYGDTIKKAYGFAGATVNGSISGGNAQVELATPVPFRSFGPVNQRAAAAYAETQAGIEAMDALHEILHLAGRSGYDDFAYANTVAAMRGVKPPDYSGMAYKDAVRAASTYWNGALQAACKPR